MNTIRRCYEFLILLSFFDFSWNFSLESWLAEGEALLNKKQVFKIKNCGSLRMPIQIKQFEIEPNIFKLPQNISLNSLLKINRDIHAPIQAELSMIKEVPFVGPVDIPCVAGFGSCIYRNICPMLVAGQATADKVYANSTNGCTWSRGLGLPCNCPFLQGEYRANNVIMPVSNSMLPSWLESGSYKATFKLKDLKNTVGCFLINFTLL